MKPRLIIINGPCGVGKSTIAQRYLDHHPLAMHLKIDEVIAMLGQWEKDEHVTRPLAIEYAKLIAKAHLQKGYDVVLPYIIVNAEIAEAFERITYDEGAQFLEFVLMVDKKESVARMLKRGTWGEPGAPPITEKDIPIIEELYDKMQEALKKRPRTTSVASINGEIEQTYKQIEAYL